MEKLYDETWKNDMERDSQLYEADQIPEKEDDDWQARALARVYRIFFRTSFVRKKVCFFLGQGL